ncbi:MAG: hypothetical protein ACREHD_24510, partial [Pirellulales bacterium]
MAQAAAPIAGQGVTPPNAVVVSVAAPATPDATSLADLETAIDNALQKAGFGGSQTATSPPRGYDVWAGVSTAPSTSGHLMLSSNAAWLEVIADQFGVYDSHHAQVPNNDASLYPTYYPDAGVPMAGYNALGFSDGASTALVNSGTTTLLAGTAAPADGVLPSDAWINVTVDGRNPTAVYLPQSATGTDATAADPITALAAALNNALSASNSDWGIPAGAQANDVWADVSNGFLSLNTNVAASGFLTISLDAPYQLETTGYDRMLAVASTSSRSASSGSADTVVMYAGPGAPDFMWGVGINVTYVESNGQQVENVNAQSEEQQFISFAKNVPGVWLVQGDQADDDKMTVDQEDIFDKNNQDLGSYFAVSQDLP